MSVSIHRFVITAHLLTKDYRSISLRFQVDSLRQQVLYFECHLVLLYQLGCGSLFVYVDDDKTQMMDCMEQRMLSRLLDHMANRRCCMQSVIACH